MNNNSIMSKGLKNALADRLAALMDSTPGLDTLMKVAEKSGVSYGTVRAIKNMSVGTDVSIGRVEDVARCFGLTINQFLDGRESALSSNEAEVIKALRALPEEEADLFAHQIIRSAMMHRELSRSREVRYLIESGGQDSQSHESLSSRKNQ